MQRLRVRIASLVVLSLVVGCADEHPPLPPPPAEATASCVYEWSYEGRQGTSTLWFNSLDQVIRIDGPALDDRETYLVATSLHYDADGRMIAQENPRGASTWTYSPDQIERTGWFPGVMQLVDGRVTHQEFPTYKAPENRNVRDYTYDAAGRLVRYTEDNPYDAGQGMTTHSPWMTEYTYDQRGRVVSAKQANQEPVTFTYYDAADRVTVGITSRGLGFRRWVYVFDADHRLVRHEVTFDDVTRYADYIYSEGVIEQRVGPYPYSVIATGRCDPPMPTFTPTLPLPVRSDASYTQFLDLSTVYGGTPFD